MDHLHEFHLAQDPPLPKAQSPSPTHWSPPTSPVYKLNFDGALFQDISSVGIGVVNRDHEGKAIGALAERIALPTTVKDVEVLAFRRAISFALDIGLQEVMVEGDSETIISYLSLDSTCLAFLVILLKTLVTQC